jgi:hypothetical protein
MSYELVNTLATCATFLVIAVTAIAALVQLRHMRSSNQMTAFNDLRHTFESASLAAAHKYVDTQLHRDLEDPAFRYAIGHRSARTEEMHERIRHLLNFDYFFETIGLLVKFNFVPAELVFATWSEIIAWAWKRMVPVVAIYRTTQDPLAWENFEYAALLAERWLQSHPDGGYPRNTPRMPLEYPWAQADRDYAASVSAPRDNADA